MSAVWCCMRFGVISDVHGNLSALEAALAELRRAGVDQVLCAGDLVGYGPLPNECVATIAESGALVVAGNHDLAAAGRLDPHGSPMARSTMEWTREVLADDARDYLYGLPTQLSVGGDVVMAHGSLGDPRGYIWGGRPAAAQLDQLAQVAPGAGVLLLGHTHEPLATGPSGRTLLYLRRATIAFARHDRVLLNPGSVGQSRLRSADARILLLDLERRTAQFAGVAYDDNLVREQLAGRGLPPDLHHRRPPLRHADLPRRLRRRLVETGVTVLRRGAKAARHRFRHGP
jgi:predicted phosphodiesterase